MNVVLRYLLILNNTTLFHTTQYVRNQRFTGALKLMEAWTPDSESPEETKQTESSVVADQQHAGDRRNNNIISINSGNSSCSGHSGTSLVKRSATTAEIVDSTTLPPHCKIPTQSPTLHNTVAHPNWNSTRNQSTVAVHGSHAASHTSPSATLPSVHNGSASATLQIPHRGIKSYPFRALRFEKVRF